MKLDRLKYSFSSKKETLFTLLVIVCLGSLLQLNYIHEFPSNTHAWAQSGRFAIAQGFVNNELNFFKPETFIMNKQFPDRFHSPSPTSITSVDFPIHGYFIAVIMKISGSKSPFIFRFYTLLYSFLGLFFLYRLSYLVNKRFSLSLLLVVFAATSPVFVYYQGGFLPTIPSLSNAIIGVYFLIKHLKNDKNVDFNASIFFLTLAALNRTTFAIPLIAAFCYVLLKVLQNKMKLRPKIFPIVLSIGALIGYYLYNLYLRENYGSIFLNNLLPARSFQEFKDIWNTALDLWGTQYFSTVHYYIFLGITAIVLLLRLLKVGPQPKKNNQMLLYALIMLFGSVAFAFLMFRQFSFHDYYFLDSFFLPLLLLLLYLFSSLPSGKIIRLSTLIFTLAISFPLIVTAFNSQKDRDEHMWNRTDSTIENFTGSEQLLDSLNIPEDAKMLVFTPHVPNIPFLLMNRKGYVVFEMKSAVFKKALLWDYDFIVLQNDLLLSDIYPIYPEILSRVTKVFDNGKISICKFNPFPFPQSLSDFMNIKSPVFESMVNYDTKTDKNWKITTSTPTKFYSAPNAGLLNDTMEYGLTYKTSNFSEITKKDCIFSLESYFFSKKEIEKCLIVVAIREDEEVKFFQRFPLKDYLNSMNQWEKVEAYCMLPKVDSENYELSLFIWNPARESLFLDDFKIKIY